MGYELKLKIGTYGKTLFRPSDKPCFFTDITIDLSCCGDSNIGRLAQESFSKEALPKMRWYEGNNTITEDIHGSEPSPVPLAKIIKALKQDIKVDNYRRFRWALATIEAVEKHDKKGSIRYNEFTAIFEGH
jgi:hypothetical protein